MWVMVFFDLPVKSKEQRRLATRFRNFLKDDGFIMLQLSVYARICRGQPAVEKHVRRVRQNLPGDGCVRALQVTEKQFSRMELLLGFAKKTEKLGAKQMVLL